MSKRIGVFLLLAVLLLTACTTKWNVVNASARDTIFSVEQTTRNAWAVFLTHDDSVLYCTTDEELGQKAMTLLKEHDGEVIIDFRTLRSRDEANDFWGGSDCQAYYNGEGSFVGVLLEDIKPAPGNR